MSPALALGLLAGGAWMFLLGVLWFAVARLVAWDIGEPGWRPSGPWWLMVAGWAVALAAPVMAAV